MAKEPAKADVDPAIVGPNDGPDAPRPVAPDEPPAAGPFKGAQPSGDPAPAGGVEVELLSDYWPAEQPEPETDPKKLSNEVRLRAGEKVSLPQEEVMNLLERGLAKRVQR